MSDIDMPDMGSTEFGGSWGEKQSFIVKFLDELGTFIERKCSEFELPPVVVVGALEVLKNEWLNAGMEYIIEDGDDDDDDSKLPFETDETED
jgi:hypothetical protein